MSKAKKILIILAAVFLLLVGGSLIYLATGNYDSKDLAKAYMISDENSTVTIKNGINFSPVKPNGTGVILYQGGKVDGSAYSVDAKILADNGYTVFVPKMPFNMAFFGINKADKIIEENPDISEWYMCGHSLGGSMAAKYTSNNRNKINGLILLASYSVDDLSDYTGRVLSIIGTKDMGIDQKKLDETSVNLPADTEFYIIEGGNHSQFGDYGFQRGDNIADISLEEQLNLITNKMLEFLENNNIHEDESAEDQAITDISDEEMLENTVLGFLDAVSIDEEYYYFSTGTISIVGSEDEYRNGDKSDFYFIIKESHSSWENVLISGVWIGGDMAEVEITGDRMAEGMKYEGDIVKFRFVKEQGEWKIDFSP